MDYLYYCFFLLQLLQFNERINVSRPVKCDSRYIFTLRFKKNQGRDVYFSQFLWNSQPYFQLKLISKIVLNYTGEVTIPTIKRGKATPAQVTKWRIYYVMNKND